MAKTAKSSADLITFHIQFPKEVANRISQAANDFNQTRTSIIKLAVSGWLLDHGYKPQLIDLSHEEALESAFQNFWANMTEEQRAAWVRQTSE